MNIINKSKQIEITANMKGVIDTSKQIRDALLDPSVSFKDKNDNIEIYKLMINANKSIVSATATELTAAKLACVKVDNDA
jgi:hypothetical protein